MNLILIPFVFRQLNNICFIIVILCLGIMSSYAQSDTSTNKPKQLPADTVRLKTVSVFGYSETQKANRQAYNITAIDAKKLHNSTLDIAQVLNRVPGARLRETGGIGSDFDFSISGFSGKRIKFFLDGVPMDGFGSAFQINNIPVNMAERVEVYKGVVPIWLGSDALGGAVNIITNNKMKNFVDASYAYGSFNTHRSYLNVGYTSPGGFALRLNAFQNYSDNNYKVTLDAANIRTGKYYRDTTLRRFHDNYHNETAIVQMGLVGQKWADELLLGITLGQYYKEIQTAATQDVVFGAWHERGAIVMPAIKFRKKGFLTKHLDMTLNANYNLGKISNVDTVHARFGWLRDSITYRGKGGEYMYNYYKYRNNNANVNASLAYRINDHHSLALNNSFSRFNRRGENLVNPLQIDNIPQVNNKNILGLSYQYELPEKLDLTVFGKYYSQKGHTELVDIDYSRDPDTLYIPKQVGRNEFTYGGALSYFVISRLQMRASYEKALRLPDHEELFGDVVYREGNWDLLPETSDNVNIGLNYTLPIHQHRFYISAIGTYKKADDYMYDTFSPLENKLVTKNLVKVSSVGVESEIRYSYGRLLTLGASLTYQNIRDKHPYRTDILTDPPLPSPTYNERIPNIPYLYGNADALLLLNDVLEQNDRLSIGYNMLYVHQFYLYWAIDGAPETKRTIPEQLSHDISIVYILKNGRYNIGFECRNITNDRLYDNFSLQKPGRSFSLKVRYFLNK